MASPRGAARARMRIGAGRLTTWQANPSTWTDFLSIRSDPLQSPVLRCAIPKDVRMWIRRSVLAVALVVASFVLGGMPQGVASDDEPPRVVPYGICEFMPWWPGCR